MVVVVSLGNSSLLASRIARGLGSKCKVVRVKVGAFPDRDMLMRYLGDVRRQEVILVQSFQPNPQKSLSLIQFAALGAKQLGAKSVTLVAPYLAYMRQDKMFNPGEVISARVMAKVLGVCVDKLITVDPHLHRVRRMKDLFGSMDARAISANPLIGEYVKKKFRNVVVVGPDWGSFQWAREVASICGSECTVFEKTRYSSRNVKVKMMKQVDMKGKNVVIVDDIISTGHTVIEAAKKSWSLGAKTVRCIGVHGLFAENAISKLKRSGKLTEVISCNTIVHPSNKIDVSGIIVKELKRRKKSSKK